MRLSRLRLVVLAAIAALFAASAACNSSSSSSTATATPSPSSTSSATAPASATSAASPSPSATASASASATTVAVDPAAMQVLVDYYQAINEQHYDAAYRLWAGNGAASKQTSSEFANGFAQTVRSVIHFGKPSAAASGVQVPATVLAVVNTGSSTQAVQDFEGTYTLAETGGAWHIASASLARKADLTAVYPDTASDKGTLGSYYEAINTGELARAYSYWEGNGTSSGQSFAAFANGFAQTASSTLTMGEPQQGAAAGSVYSDIPVFIVAKQSDGTQRAFCGKYTLRQSNVPPFPWLGWGIYSASVAPYSGAIPSGDAIQALLAHGCTG